MIGRGGMSDIRSGIARHVTLNATILRARLSAHLFGQAARVFSLMTDQALLPEIDDALFCSDVLVRVVAGSAAEFPFALLGMFLTLLEASTAIHLLDVANRLSLFFETGCGNKCRPEGFQRQRRSIVVQASTNGQHATGDREMALLTNRFPQVRRQ